ncbi:1187_t:CDS:2 [Ambispora gerdemannii]|uniref:1187_t:CDS:1 n=1 Tax=Ambispora gerdemannii TaxID=144530 RepID=A0A9N8UVW5_9GLOM|nr:1187_t:CDS:2 [Ambispora gerdemannii]
MAFINPKCIFKHRKTRLPIITIINTTNNNSNVRQFHSTPFVNYPSAESMTPKKTTLSIPRPGLYTQKIILTDGATYTIQTTSPKPFVKLVRDTRNHPLWNPEMKHGMQDESGQLSKFQRKFGEDTHYELEFMESGEKVPELSAKELQGMSKPKKGKVAKLKELEKRRNKKRIYAQGVSFRIPQGVQLEVKGRKEGCGILARMIRPRVRFATDTRHPETEEYLSFLLQDANMNQLRNTPGIILKARMQQTDHPYSLDYHFVIVDYAL